LFPLPNGVSDKVGAFIEPISVALHVINRSEFKKGSTALVFGAGTIGLLTGMWLKVFGAKKIVIASRSSESLATAKKAGFDDVIGINDDNFENYKDFDYCYEAAGSIKAIIQSIEKCKSKGTVTIVGRDTKDLNIPLKKFEEMMRKELNVLGCWGYKAQDKDTILEHLDKIDALPLITKEADISDGVQLIKKMFNKEEYFCKVLFKFDD